MARCKVYQRNTQKVMALLDDTFCSQVSLCTVVLVVHTLVTLLTEAATDRQLFPHKLLPTPPTLLSSSPLTPPCLFVGHLYRWKISTRGRKKSLEDSLKSADYSDHALIPVYGFQCVDDPEAAGLEERRKELCRLEARALAAERTALERRSRAEGGAGGAAFARAMSRRALARADWIQKVPKQT